MVIAVALGILIPLHDHTLLFIIMCWSLFIHRWIFLAEHEDKRKVFIKCGLLIVCSIYAYVNGELTMANIWIRPPGILYYHLFFILHELNQSVQSKGTFDTKNVSLSVPSLSERQNQKIFDFVFL